MIKFLEFFFIIFKTKALDKVSIVLPDFEIIKISVFFKYLFFLKSNIFLVLRSSKKYIFFFIFFS